MAPLSDPVIVAAAVAAVVFVAGAAMAAIVRPSAAPVPDERLIALETRLAVFERRLGRQEDAVKDVSHDVRNLRMTVAGLATKDSVTDLAVRMGELAGSVHAVETTVTAMHRSVERVENFLMDAAAKRIAGVSEPKSEGSNKA